ncbi:MAG: glycoside hydrolase family 2 protein [Lachnospiraceae bacterium]|nr:glycoside hydrolase family 2 protein [Lachnospiraceae bacterium]
MERLDFNSGWFYQRLGSGDERQEQKTEVTLPHDAMLCEPRADENPGGNNIGYFAGADYLYTKSFFVPDSWEDKTVMLEFEGVYRNAEIHINGKMAANRPSGYADFYVEADAFLEYGQENHIRVLARNADQPNSRWYSGAGIYRPVWLHVGEKAHILPTGVQVHTVGIQPARVEFHIRTSAAGKLRVEVLDGEEILFSQEQETRGELRLQAQLPDALLWSVEQPRLYTYRVSFGKDCCQGHFGIRMLQWDAGKGLQINRERVILKGACIHHDNGLLGACSYPEAERRRVRILKANGYNAIRCAHNPCSSALLDACDRLGMLVMDEYTDMWYIHKTAYDYADHMQQWWREDLRDMVEKDYNHPCVILYSTGNEVAETAQKKGIALTGQMTEYLHGMDPTRPVTCGVNIFFNLLSSLGFGVYSDKKAEKEKKKKPVGSEFYNTLAGMLGDTAMKLGATLHGCDVKTRDAFANMDIAGYNYGILRYRHDLKKYPGRLILGSETFCRDAYRFWELARDNPRIIGDFVWAGMDYLGEAGIGAWEYEDYAPSGAPRWGWLTAGSGRIDLTGRPLGEAAYTKVALESTPGPFLAVRPVYQRGKHSPSAWKMTDAMESWSWRGCEGERASVEVYTRAAEAELFLNGRSIDRKKRKRDCRILFRLPYENGVLTAVVYDGNGREQGRVSLETAGEETVLRAAAEEREMKPGSLAYIRIRYEDGRGILKPMERHRIKIQVSGGQLLGFGNACPYNPEGFLHTETETYYGEALAIVRAGHAEEAGHTAAVQITVSDGEREEAVRIPIEISKNRKYKAERMGE